jgi:hypothetical protein
MSKYQRNKGATEERRVAKLYSFALNRTVERELSQYQHSSGRDLKGCQPWIVQCKKGKKLNYRTAIDEATNAMGEGYAYPVAHLNEDYKEPVVVLPEKLWMTIVELLTNNKIMS